MMMALIVSHVRTTVNHNIHWLGGKSWQHSPRRYNPPASFYVAVVAGARRADAGGGKPLQRPGPLRTSQTQRTPRSRENSAPTTPTPEGACLHLSTKKDDRTRKVQCLSPELPSAICAAKKQPWWLPSIQYSDPFQFAGPLQTQQV